MKWTWLDELVHNILALIIVVPTVVVLTARAFNPDVYVPPELLAASVAVLTVYGYSVIKANNITISSDATPANTTTKT